uniref:FIST C domain protein n=1 Tax=Cyanothece sp. (strain PCC 7425 / ATCC 29141) TaxID=395961 RepID=B8HXK9_CYAP4
MKWASAISTRYSLEAAVKEVTRQTQHALGQPADLALVFISSSFASEYSRLLPLLQDHLTVPHLIGCGGEGVIGMNRDGEPEEVESEPALALMLGHLPGVNLHPFHIVAEDLPDLDSPPDQWVDLIGVAVETQPHFVLLADALTAKINDLLQGLDYAYPGAIKIGGLTNSNNSRGCGLFCNSTLYREGCIGIALSGNLVLETIVAQGCRPIGEPYRVAEAERNIVLKLEPLTVEASPSSASARLQTPLEALEDLIRELSESDRQLAQDSLFVGVVRDEFKQTLEPGDFLIRNLIGLDPRAGAIAIGDRVRPGQRIQFHLRDSEASAAELELLLQRYNQNLEVGANPIGALLFSCLGRGVGLYGKPHFDSRLFSRYLNTIPLSGFFCYGEIGPLGGETFLHGYTSAFGIFRSP